MTARQDPARALQPHSGLRARAFVYLLRAANARYELWIAERKRALLGSLRGTILEIGPGAGVNLGYYAPGITWIGIEPNVYMQPHLRREAESRGLQVDLRTGVAERFEAADHSADALASTLVLAPVASVADVLQAIHRALNPGG